MIGIDKEDMEHEQKIIKMVQSSRLGKYIDTSEERTKKAIDQLNSIIKETLGPYNIIVCPDVDREGILLPFPWTKHGYIGCMWGGDEPDHFVLAQRRGLLSRLGLPTSFKPIAEVTAYPIKDGLVSTIYDSKGLHNIKIKLHNQKFFDEIRTFSKRYKEVSGKEVQIVNCSD